MTERDLTVQDNLLPSCTVRIEVGSAHKGTGFFVAPGHVVTCHHVIQSQQLSSPDAQTEIAVIDSDGVRHEVIAGTAKSWPEEDIAHLRVGDRHDRLCVLLEQDNVRARDQLHTYGYPAKHKEGVPTVIDAEGETGGDRPRVRLREGQVQPGMSGSPVLNLRTGGVCAILKSTRDEHQALGGYGIPIRTLFRLEPTIQRANERFHEKDDRWYRILEAKQQRLLRAGWKTRRADDDSTRQFVVSVGQTATGWEVSANVYPDDEPTDAVPVDLNAVRLEVARLFRDWASRGRVHEPDQIRLLGGILYTALFPDEIGARFEALLARRQEEPFHVALSFEQGTDRDLIQLPWEHLYVPRRRGRAASDVYLAVDGALGFARTLMSKPVATERPPVRDLSIFVAAFRPDLGDGAGALSTRGKLVEGIVDDIKRLAAQIEGVVVEDALNLDSEGLKTICTPDYDVVHYVGFGRFENGADELALGANTDAGIDYFPIGALAGAIQDDPPKLVVLQLAEGPPDAVPADFSVLAPPLLEQRVEAVVAHQSPLGRDPSLRFNGALYAALGRGASVTEAVQQGREKLRTLVGARASVSPALFLRTPGELRLIAPVPASFRRKGVLTPSGA